jgi:hypothetical protein
MKPRSHLPTAATLALASFLLGAVPRSGPLEPGKLIILSTTDVKGKNEPCG